MRNTTRLALLLALGLSACMPQRFYVRDVRVDQSGALVQQKCELTGGGRATDDCHDELIAQPQMQAPMPAPPSAAPPAAAAAAPMSAPIQQ